MLGKFVNVLLRISEKKYIYIVRYIGISDFKTNKYLYRYQPSKSFISRALVPIKSLYTPIVKCVQTYCTIIHINNIATVL